MLGISITLVDKCGPILQSLTTIACTKGIYVESTMVCVYLDDAETEGHGTVKVR